MILAHVKKLVVDTMTGPDGQTWALGRFYSFPIMATGLWIIVDTHLHNRAVPGMGDLGIGLAGVGAATMMMLTGTKGIDTEPTGKGLTEQVLAAAHLTGISK